MAQSKIIIDTNSYLRIAFVIHPLLMQEFGEEKYCIYSLPDLEKEDENKISLHSKFKWFNEPRFQENRKNTLFLNKNQIKAIEEKISFLKYASKELNLLNVSLTDMRCLAYGWELNFPVVTEDKEMTELADEYKIKVLKTLDLLKIMNSKNHISKKHFLDLQSYLIEIEEYPKVYESFFKQFQKENKS